MLNSNIMSFADRQVYARDDGFGYFKNERMTGRQLTFT
jgi:hypothetical protein